MYFVVAYRFDSGLVRVRQCGDIEVAGVPYSPCYALVRLRTFFLAVMSPSGQQGTPHEVSKPLQVQPRSRNSSLLAVLAWELSYLYLCIGETRGEGAFLPYVSINFECSNNCSTVQQVSFAISMYYVPNARCIQHPSITLRSQAEQQYKNIILIFW